MKINIKVENKDNRFGGRNLDITLGNKRLRTPERTANQKEYYASSTLPYDVTIENTLSEYVNNFPKNALDAFLKGNGSFHRRITKMENNALPLMQYSKNISSITFPNNTRLEDNDHLMLFLMLQKSSEIDFISLPPFKYDNEKEYRSITTDYCNQAISRGQVPMPILYISENVSIFKKEFQILRDLHLNGLIDMIGFKYATPKRNIQQFLEIYKHRDEAIWFHCIGVPRTKRSDPLAEIHELQNWGLDTFSSESKYYNQKQAAYFSMQGKDKKPEDVKTKRFDQITLGILTEENWHDKYNDLHCNCPVCKGLDLDAYKDKYTYELDDSFNPRILQQADKLHDLFAGTDEFKKSKKEIRSDNLHKYFEDHEYSRGISPPE